VSEGWKVLPTCVCPMGWQPWVCIYSVQVKIMRNGNNISMLGASGAWAAGAGVKVYLLTCKPEVFTSHPVKSYINVSVLGFGCKVCTFVKAGWKLVGRQLAINMRILSAS